MKKILISIYILGIICASFNSMAQQNSNTKHIITIGKQEVINAINGQQGALWQKEKKAVVALVYVNQDKTYYKYTGTGFLISPVNENPDYLYLLTTASNIGIRGSGSFTELQQNAKDMYLVFNFEEPGNVTQMYTPKEVIEEYYIRFPHAQGLEAISKTNSYFDNQHQAVLLKIAKNKIPTSVTYYQLGWDFRTPYFTGRLIGNLMDYYNKMNTKSILTLSCNESSTNGNNEDEINSSTVESQKIDEGYIGAPVFDLSKKVNHVMSYFYQGRKKAYPLHEMQNDNLSGFYTYISNGQTENDGKYCLNQKTLNYSSPIYSTQNIKADENIYISSVVYGGSCIAAANESIELKPGFEVKPGASFEANNNPCH